MCEKTSTLERNEFIFDAMRCDAIRCNSLSLSLERQQGTIGLLVFLTYCKRKLVRLFDFKFDAFASVFCFQVVLFYLNCIELHVCPAFDLIIA